MTQDGSIMGSPSYMAPEQAEEKIREVGTLADVYSVGAILYEQLTGPPPFRGETLIATLTMVRTQEPVPPSRHNNARVPHDLETIWPAARSICLRTARACAMGRHRPGR